MLCRNEAMAEDLRKGVQGEHHQSGKDQKANREDDSDLAIGAESLRRREVGVECRSTTARDARPHCRT